MEEQTKALVVTGNQAPTVLNWSDDEVALIRDTVAKKATPAEFKLFLYRCKNMGLDPLKPGLIHFVKYGDSPGTIVVGIDGFRSRAARTGRHSGTKRGVVRDGKGKCLGAWAEVYRSDWNQPAREEVSLSEYNTGRSQWSKMPETMIKKVAEAAALRIAFPDELGGVYANEEMDQAEEQEQKKRPSNVRSIGEPPGPGYGDDPHATDDFVESAKEEPLSVEEGAAKAVDATTPISGDDINKLFTHGKSKGWKQKQVMSFIREKFHKSPSQLDRRELGLVACSIEQGSPKD